MCADEFRQMLQTFLPGIYLQGWQDIHHELRETTNTPNVLSYETPRYSGLCLGMLPSSQFLNDPAYICHKTFC